jgi:hypothetical protein
MGAVARLVEIQKMETAEGAPLLLRRAKYIAEDAVLEAADEDDRARAKESSRNSMAYPWPKPAPTDHLNISIAARYAFSASSKRN